MTASTQGLAAQGLAGSGIPSPQGSFVPGFPPPIGAEHYFATPSPYGFQTYGWPQATYGMQPPYGQQPGPVQIPYHSQPAFGFPPSAGQYGPQQQQLIQQLVGQILPIAQQMILPQVIAQAVQLVQQQAQQLITQLAVPQLVGQQPSWAQQWQPFWAQQPFSAQPGSMLPTRPFPLFS